MLNGSPRKDGNTKIALEEMKKIFSAEGIDCEIVDISTQAVRGCIACNSCYKNGKCVFDDCVNEIAPKFVSGGRTCSRFTRILRFGERFFGRSFRQTLLQRAH